jgi:GTP cyclohydrolase II
MLKEPGKVKLSLYNMSGQGTTTENEYTEKGTYEKRYDAKDMMLRIFPIESITSI